MIGYVFSGDPQAESAKSLREERVLLNRTRGHALPCGSPLNDSIRRVGHAFRLARRPRYADKWGPAFHEMVEPALFHPAGADAGICILVASADLRPQIRAAAGA